MLLYCQNHPQNAILSASQPYLRSTDWDPETLCYTHDPPLLLFHLEQELIFHCHHLPSVNVRNNIGAYCKSFDIRACLHPSLTPATFPSSQTWGCSWEMPWTAMEVHTRAFMQDYSLAQQDNLFLFFSGAFPVSQCLQTPLPQNFPSACSSLPLTDSLSSSLPVPQKLPQLTPACPSKIPRA